MNITGEDHHHHHRHHQPPPKKFWIIFRNHLSSHKYAAYVIAIAITYALGYFTALPSTTLSSKQAIFTSTAVADVITTNNCPPVTSSPVLDMNNDHNLFGPKCADPVPYSLVRSTVLNRVFNGTSPYENFPPAHVAHLLRPKRVRGWDSNAAVFRNLITRVRPKTIIEVGSFLGASAIHMAELTRQLGMETQILCLDDFRGWAGFRDKIEYVPMQNGDVLLYAQFLQNVLYFNSSELILPIPFSTGSTLEKLCEWGVMGDLIEIDAGHDFHSAWADINRAHKLLRPGGVLFGHDYFLMYDDDRGVRRAVDLFAKVHGLKVSVDGQHWVIE